MINSSLKRAVVVAMLAGASVGANAATNDVGTVLFSVPTSFSGFVEGNATGLNDIILFTPEATSLASGFSVMNLPITLSGDDGGSFGLSLATVSLSSTGADGVIGGGDDQMLKAAVFTDLGNTNDHISFTYDQPLTGPSYLNITGVTDGSLGGIYNGAIQISPVPEPESFAMLLAGLGLMGAVVRRRSSHKNS